MPRRPRTLNDMLRAAAGIKPDRKNDPKRNSYSYRVAMEIAAWDRKHGIKFRATKTLVRLTGLPEEEILRLKNRKSTAKPIEPVQPDENK